MKKRLAIFASGNGSNAENIIRYFAGADRNAEVVLVLSNRPEAKVLTRAENLGVSTRTVSRTEFNDSDTMTALLKEFAVDAIVLAGFLLMVPGFLLRRYEKRMINIHPSLLPKYGGKGMYGHHVHEAVVAAGEKETGITVHLVSDKCDGGAIIFQARTGIEPSDTPTDVEAKVHQLEHDNFPRVIELWLAGEFAQ